MCARYLWHAGSWCGLVKLSSFLSMSVQGKPRACPSNVCKCHVRGRAKHKGRVRIEDRSRLPGTARHRLYRSTVPKMVLRYQAVAIWGTVGVHLPWKGSLHRFAHLQSLYHDSVVCHVFNTTQRLRIIPSFKSAALTRIESLTVNPQALRLAQTSLHFQTVHLACCLGEYVHSGQMRNTGPLPLGTTSGTSRCHLSRNRQAPVGVEPRPPASAHSVSRVSSRACLALAPY